MPKENTIEDDNYPIGTNLNQTGEESLNILKKVSKIMSENNMTSIEEKIKEFDREFGYQFLRTSGRRLAKEYIKQSLHDIRRQALEEAIGCAPTIYDDIPEDSSNTNWKRGYRSAVADYQSNIKELIK